MHTICDQLIPPQISVECKLNSQNYRRLILPFKLDGLSSVEYVYFFRHYDDQKLLFEPPG